MQLLFLGTTGYHPNSQRDTACLMIPEMGLMLDAGTGIFRARDHLQTPQLDIFLTHAHLDHCVGLTFLFDVLHERDVNQVVVHAEPEKINAISRHLFSPLLFPVKPPFQFCKLAQNKTLSHDCRLTYFPLEHPGGSVGYRLDFPNFSLAYVSDTTASVDAAYVEKIGGVDLLIHECYFPDGSEEHAKLTGHSCMTPVAQVARAAEVGRLILVHMNPLIETDDPVGMEKSRAIFPQVELAYDGMSIELDV